MGPQFPKGALPSGSGQAQGPAPTGRPQGAAPTDVRMYDVSVVALAPAIHNASGFKVSDELSNFSWHPFRVVSELTWKVS